MAKKKTSDADDLMNFVAKLPWWGGVVMAFVSYLLLRQLAAPVEGAALQPGQVGGFALRAMVAAFANIGQYVLPLICLSGAAVSFFRRRKRESLVADVAQAKSASVLDGMTWREFEMLVGEGFQRQGFAVAETGGGGADGGIDLVLTKGDEKFLVQCKQWKAFKVGVDVVRELYGVMAANGAAGGYVVTSGTFTADARAFADGRNVKLVDGQALFGMIQQARKSASTGTVSPIAPSTASVEPSCPVCASAMVRRAAKKGANAGAQFWGCSKYPGCRGTRPA